MAYGESNGHVTTSCDREMSMSWPRYIRGPFIATTATDTDLVAMEQL